MFDRNIVDYDAEWNMHDEEIMRENNDFINVEDVDDDYQINGEVEHQIEEENQNVYEEHSNDEREGDDETQSASEIRIQYEEDQSEDSDSYTEGSEDEKNNSFSDNQQLSNSDEHQSDDDGGSSCNEEEYCPYCDAQRYYEESVSSCNEEEEEAQEQQSDVESEPPNQTSDEKQVEQESPLLTEDQPIVCDGLQINGFRLEPILPCGHAEQLTAAQVTKYYMEQQQKNEETGQQFLISLPYMNNNGTRFYRCMCGCSLLFDENANIFFDMSNKRASDVSNCKFHCPCGCDNMFRASDIILNPIFYGFYQKMIRTKFLTQRTNVNDGDIFECKQCLNKSHEYRDQIQEQHVDGNYDADDED